MPVQNIHGNKDRKDGKFNHVFQVVLKKETIEKMDLISFAERRSVSSIVIESLENFVERTNVPKEISDKFEKIKQLQKEVGELKKR
jgi:hypothetical protein